MIDVIFYFGSEIVLVRVRDTQVLFAGSSSGMQMAPIDGLRLDHSGVLREFPDLKDNKEWRAIAISRFKDKIRSFSTEDERVQYIITDLKKHGYTPKFYQKAGFRRQKVA